MVSKTTVWVRTSLLSKQFKHNEKLLAKKKEDDDIQKASSPLVSPTSRSSKLFEDSNLSPSSKKRFLRIRTPTLSSSSTADLDREGGIFDWTRCQILAGDLSRYESDGVKVHIIEPSSVHTGKTIELPGTLFRSNGAKSNNSILMANEWATSDLVTSAKSSSKVKKSETSAKGSKKSLLSSKSKSKSKSSVSRPPDDLIQLTHLHEPAIVHTLEQRYKQDIIYTDTGPILLVLNPFKNLPHLYEDSVMNEYWMLGEKCFPSAHVTPDTQTKSKTKKTEGVIPTDLKPARPHIYQSSHRAFTAMIKALDKQRSERIEARLVDKDDNSSNHNNHNNNGGAVSGQSCMIDQSLLVSGESGAGKTVTTKHAMKYLASLSHRQAEFDSQRRKRRAASPERSLPARTTSGSRNGNFMLSATTSSSSDHRQQFDRSNSSRRGIAQTKDGISTRRLAEVLAHQWKAGAVIEERILESNPILESFGNARTVRNDNSSRFGKFIELQFKESGAMVGANIDTYLLEKVRLVHLMEGERNFHIFYEFLEAAAAEDSDRKVYHLKDNCSTAKDFKMTNGSGTYDRRDGADDASLFEELVFAMGTMGFDPQTQQDIFACIGAFLHASNLTFAAPTEDSSKVDTTNPHLVAVLDLLGLEAEAFNAAMTEYEIDVGSSCYTRQLTAEGASKTLEAFIKGTYGAMFSFIVQSINKKIDFRPTAITSNSSSGQAAASISVLDIFGFESFPINSFEQLCINYCNEALQQQFNQFIFKSEQDEYLREGVVWDFVSFPDNQDVIDLIDGKATGILSILTDTCRTPRGTDKSFFDSMSAQAETHPRYLGQALHKANRQFVIDHYAGPVLYHCEGFVEKNKDETPRGAASLLESSSKEFVQLMGKILGTSMGTSMNTIALDPGARSTKTQKRPTVGGQFSSQLTNLRRRIASSAPHYIRCLKPNHLLQPAKFDQGMVADQLRYAGVLEAIRVSRAGFSQRYTHRGFLQRYRFIAVEQVAAAAENKKLQTLVAHVANKVRESKSSAPPPSNALTGESAVGIQIGRSKVFLQQPAFELLERFRSEQVNKSCAVLQSIVRGYLARRQCRRDIRRLILVQCFVRCVFARSRFLQLKKEQASIRIQSRIRGWQTRRMYLARKVVALILQRYARGRSERKLYTSMVMAHLAAQQRLVVEGLSATKIQCLYRKIVAQRWYEKLVAQRRDQSSKLEGTALLAALRSDKAAAVAKESVMAKTKQVGDLSTQLASATGSAERASLAMQEVGALGIALAESKRKIELLVEQVEAAAARADRLEAENRMLKARLASPSSMSLGTSSAYDEYDDMKVLDASLQSMLSRSAKSKQDTFDLVESLKMMDFK